MADDIWYRGLNVSAFDATDPAEIEEFLAFGDQPGGGPVPSYEMWAKLRPDVLKRLLNYVHHIHKADAFETPLPYVNIYATGGWADGVRNIIRICEPSTFLSGTGYTKAAVTETLALSFYLSPTWNTAITAKAAQEALATYREPAPDAPSPYPEGWSIDPAALKAGLDYDDPDLTKADVAALKTWYEQVCGEIPPWIDLYAKYRPTLLKSGRNRWENIVREGLPNQMFAFLLIHYAVFTNNVADIRESLLLARGLGMAKEHAVDAVFYGGSFFGGMNKLGNVAETVEEVLDVW
ncbi:hypothetical protein GGQ22_01330 [Nocardioides sp. zg-579]|uniref:Uncharacterized protein n=1 Tax=Nocardioides marmotae TaxID=2663857 RepID=A0A6I3JAA2_9ACTN|nr:hypothetical protein [Nocardioides marmotae]MCR6030084.1 hypothetical protein [Gordonia jinghuaiqii]MTB93715.1 hypothetical protein [Nocardioides marmotae]QKE00060.1 hypothetical protein HPC71_02400 [Nocardioides marmotae]